MTATGVDPFCGAAGEEHCKGKGFPRRDNVGFPIQTRTLIHNFIKINMYTYIAPRRIGSRERETRPGL